MARVDARSRVRELGAAAAISFGMRKHLLIVCCLLIAGCTSPMEADDVDTAVDEAELNVAVIVTQGLPAVTRMTLTTLRNAMFPATPDANYQAMANSDMAMFEQVITTLWREVTVDNYAALAIAVARIGFEVKHVVVANTELWLLREDAAHRRGRGVYLFRAGRPAARSILLEAPHVYFDIGTGAISVAAFLADATGREHALFGNSSHRYQGAVNAASGANPADPAHNTSHPIHVATTVVLKTTATTVVQLHGFGASSSIPSSVAAVVSAGVATGSSVTSTQVAGAMAVVLAGTTARYPEQTTALGATANVQGQYARSVGMAFVSIEMASSARTELAANPVAAARLGAAIVAAIPN